MKLFFLFFILIFLSLSCDDSTSSGSCNPKCKDWQKCQDSKCTVKDNFCEENKDCEDTKICGEDHKCVAGVSCGETTCGKNEDCFNKQCVCEDGFKRVENVCIESTDNSCNDCSGTGKKCINGDCLCDIGFKETLDGRCISDPCSGVICPTNQVCKVQSGIDECICPEPFVLGDNGNCVAQECKDAVCGSNEICEVKEDNSLGCSCLDGYKKDGESCIADCSNQLCDPKTFKSSCKDSKTVLSRCDTDSRGCGISIFESSCEEDSVCVMEKDNANCIFRNCTDNCDIEGKSECVDDETGIKTCTMGEDYCLDWKITSCQENYRCSVEESQNPTCITDSGCICNTGDKRCSEDSGAIEVCEVLVGDNSSCHGAHWVVETACSQAEHKMCDDTTTTCEVICEDECNPTDIGNCADETGILLSCTIGADSCYKKSINRCNDEGDGEYCNLDTNQCTPMPSNCRENPNYCENFMLGESQCEIDNNPNTIIKECTLNENHCPIWKTTECDNNQICKNGDDGVACYDKNCDDECETEYTYSCSSDYKKVLECEIVGECYKLVEKDSCQNNSICIPGRSHCRDRSCTDNCDTEGESSCSEGDSGIKTCTRGTNHCLDWSVSECSDNYSCSIDEDSQQPICMTDSGCVCNTGDKRCSEDSGAIEVCEVLVGDNSSCHGAHWVVETACSQAEHKICDDTTTTCEIICEDECNPADIGNCVDETGTLSSCTIGADGCYEKRIDICTTQKYCNLDTNECIPMPSNCRENPNYCENFMLGESQCRSERIMKECIIDENHCSVWKTTECEESEICKNGTDGMACYNKNCEDECVDGERSCSEDLNSVLICQRVGECYKWQNNNTCRDNSICVENQDITYCKNRNCTDNCDTEGESLCSEGDTGTKICIRGTNYCLDWSISECLDDYSCSIDSNTQQPICLTSGGCVCNAGDIKCSEDNKAIEVCEVLVGDNSSCHGAHWAVETTCSQVEHKMCSDTTTTCEVICEDECNPADIGNCVDETGTLSSCSVGADGCYKKMIEKCNDNDNDNGKYCNLDANECVSMPEDCNENPNYCHYSMLGEKECEMDNNDQMTILKECIIDENHCSSWKFTQCEDNLVCTGGDNGIACY